MVLFKPFQGKQIIILRYILNMLIFVPHSKRQEFGFPKLPSHIMLPAASLALLFLSPPVRPPPLQRHSWAPVAMDTHDISRSVALAAVICLRRESRRRRERSRWCRPVARATSLPWFLLFADGQRRCIALRLNLSHDLGRLCPYRAAFAFRPSTEILN